MKIEEIKEKIKNKSVKPLGVKNYYSVLVPLIKIKNEYHLLYEVRSTSLETQPGEISFPGGKIEKNETAKQAVIRETGEELNLNPRKINVIGQLDYVHSPYNLIIYPYAGLLENINLDNINFNRGEVADIFTVPLRYYLNHEPECYQLEVKPDISRAQKNGFPFHLIPDGENYNWRRGLYPVYFYQYQDHIIWGFTARITRRFIDIIKGEK